ncbi:MAG: hypothetical protein A2406_03155 [Candidatus Komeilibacteria bacterium RIFOXYC1_FULL_37_11]|uniref:DUF1648 domain-containing protein n=1 Tax=Candidatus Komeilibacteria bacterium RIFOXYC1_FULL_37_11 TaxID=1798555 RepID=A0A1G2BZF8_9BACT|nr:MAG: hypothetical protein A2406_03155 [Candidatus Komeilibacteria bacterium RIFOXYC1_FULL_37_11]OGY95915.1 MAG: hypothetical protein A2611_04530 [Candidatus Komeilibacteria bacterium RIFOXYD1_FULL_37_29]OGY97084.1 MAG: hypothetical protein A2543_00920 [Candidatus Komeilibacteria bacterium RIFOXYD2_FULL_37_8]
MKKIKFYDLISILIILVVAVSAYYFNSILPDIVITHWGFNGQPDGWGDKSLLIIFIPFLIIGIYILFRFLPKLDPKKENYIKFDSAYHAFKLVMVVFLAIIYFVSIFINLGYDLPMSDIMTWSVGILFILIGFLIKNVEQNWFMGIRTPWTMSSPEVWRKTHLMAQKVFISGGIVFLFMPYVSATFVPIIFILVIIFIVGFSFAYSYWLYRKLEKPENK